MITVEQHDVLMDLEAQGATFIQLTFGDSSHSNDTQHSYYAYVGEAITQEHLTILETAVLTSMRNENEYGRDHSERGSVAHRLYTRALEELHASAHVLADRNQLIKKTMYHYDTYVAPIIITDWSAPIEYTESPEGFDY